LRYLPSRSLSFSLRIASTIGLASATLPASSLISARTFRAFWEFISLMTAFSSFSLSSVRPWYR